MKAKQLRDMSAEQLQAKVADLNQELFNLKFQLHTGRLENTAKIVKVRKDIARTMTIHREQKG
jgi:large subunit ribosomal protein L29